MHLKPWNTIIHILKPQTFNNIKNVAYVCVEWEATLLVILMLKQFHTKSESESRMIHICVYTIYDDDEEEEEE